MSIKLKFPDQLTTVDFLREFWQQRPLLMAGALSGFRPALDPNELAGLACEPQVESRLVLEHGSSPWEVRQGPFDETTFADLPESHWTLLVQDVDKHVPEVAAILEHFDFIPDWRLDDIMISYAEDQGSVGPHTDEYDVFLIQAQGRRRWRIGPNVTSDASCIPGLDLRILEQFEAREQWILEPGDILYLPPGVPHWGIAEGPCMTWSLGLRAPDWQEMASAWCDHVIPTRLPRARYQDEDLKPPLHRGEIPETVMQRIRENIQRALLDADQDSFTSWFGAYVSESKEHLEVLPQDQPLSPETFRHALSDAGEIQRGPSKILFSVMTNGDILLFVAGEPHRLPAECHGFAALISGHRTLNAEQLAPWLTDPRCLDLLCTLYNHGHYDLAD